MYDEITSTPKTHDHMAQENVKTRPPSSADRWGTDRLLVGKLADEFGRGRFDWDFAAEASTAVSESVVTDGLKYYFGPDRTAIHLRDGLTASWSVVSSTVGFLNPPFTLLPQFVAKAYEERLKGVCIVAVLPVKAEQPWWHDYVSKADELRFLRGRLRYIDPETGQLGDSARFASAVVVWDGRKPVMMGGPRVSFWNWRA